MFGDDQLLEFVLERAGLGLGRADDRDEAGQDLDHVGVAAEPAGAVLQVGVELLRVGQRLLRGEHRFGVPGGELAAVVGRTGLHEQRPSLRRARDVERPADPEVLPGEVHRVDPGRVGVDTRGLVADLGTVLPAVPQPDGHVDELGRAPVALPVAGGVVKTEVLRGRLGRGRDDVPAGPAAADVIERGEPAGEVVRVVVGGGRGGDQPDPAGHPGQRGEQDGRLERAARTVFRVAPQRRAVGQEDRVEGAAFGAFAPGWSSARGRGSRTGRFPAAARPPHDARSPSGTR